jgi:hypothetical protein
MKRRNNSLTKDEILDFILFFPHFWEWKPSEITSFFWQNFASE